MTSANEQIIMLYEQTGLSPEQIAEDQELELVAVKATLMQLSAKYRKDMKIDKEEGGTKQLDFNEDEAEEAKRVILQTMRFTEDDHLRARLATYVRDDHKGRKDLPGLGIGRLNINVVMFQEHLKKANEALNKSEQSRSTIEASKPCNLLSKMKDRLNNRIQDAIEVPTAV